MKAQWMVTLLQDMPDYLRMLDKVFRRARMDKMRLVKFVDKNSTVLDHHRTGPVSVMVFEKEQG